LNRKSIQSEITSCQGAWVCRPEKTNSHIKNGKFRNKNGAARGVDSFDDCSKQGEIYRLDDEFIQLSFSLMLINTHQKNHIDQIDFNLKNIQQKQCEISEKTYRRLM